MNFRRCFITVLCALAAGVSTAETLRPVDDAELIETLPAASGDRAEERRLRREWSAHPADARLAVALARRWLEQARAQGDPRPAGRALAVLHAWPDAERAPDDVLLMVAT